jgi:hypothetical protein
MPRSAWWTAVLSIAEECRRPRVHPPRPQANPSPRRPPPPRRCLRRQLDHSAWPPGHPAHRIAADLLARERTPVRSVSSSPTRSAPAMSTPAPSQQRSRRTPGRTASALATASASVGSSTSPETTNGRPGSTMRLPPPPTLQARRCVTTDERRYKTPEAARRADTDILRTEAAASPWRLSDLQRQYAYDQLVERLYRLDDAWVIKGATALLLARRISVRHTIDDWMRFEVGPAVKITAHGAHARPHQGPSPHRRQTLARLPGRRRRRPDPHDRLPRTGVTPHGGPHHRPAANDLAGLPPGRPRRRQGLRDPRALQRPTLRPASRTSSTSSPSVTTQPSKPISRSGPCHGSSTTRPRPVPRLRRSRSRQSAAIGLRPAAPSASTPSASTQH